MSRTGRDLKKDRVSRLSGRPTLPPSNPFESRDYGVTLGPSGEKHDSYLNISVGSTVGENQVCNPSRSTVLRRNFWAERGCRRPRGRHCFPWRSPNPSRRETVSTWRQTVSARSQNRLKTRTSRRGNDGKGKEKEGIILHVRRKQTAIHQ